VASVEETMRLLDSIVRLRRAERVPAAAEDVAPVRRDLEAQVGSTLSRSRASRALGVSQTALDRWVDDGAVPTVVDPRGRHEVPLPFVIELAEEIENARRAGPLRHPLAVALARRRDAARKLDAGLPSPESGIRAPRDHRTSERRALAYHRVVAERLDERMLAEAKARVERLAGQGHLHPSYADRWREILSLPLDAVAEKLVEDTQGARDLRQASPFAGVLNEQERRRIIELVR
jgi:hypothetical protein